MAAYSCTQEAYSDAVTRTVTATERWVPTKLQATAPHAHTSWSAHATQGGCPRHPHISDEETHSQRRSLLGLALNPRLPAVWYWLRISSTLSGSLYLADVWDQGTQNLQYNSINSVTQVDVFLFGQLKKFNSQYKVLSYTTMSRVNLIQLYANLLPEIAHVSLIMKSNFCLHNFPSW